VTGVGDEGQSAERLSPSLSLRRIDRRYTIMRLALAAIALAMLSAGIGLRDPWPADEPRFALVAKQMVEQGQWLFPHRGDELYPDKPPLFMWLIALGYAATGSLRIAFLLPSLLAALGTLVLVHDLSKRLWNRRVALYATSALLITIQFAMQARGAQIDATLCWWTTLGLYGLLRHALLGPAWRWYWLGCVAMGFGVITKGVGFLPLLALIPYACAHAFGFRGLPALAEQQSESRLRHLLRLTWRWSLGILFLLTPIAAWLIPMLLAVGDDPHLAHYRDNILFKQTGQRYAAAWHHHHPPWYYLVQTLVLWLPLMLLLPWLLPAWWRRIRRGDSRTMILLGWVVLVLLFFSLSPGKRGVYILPAVPAFVLAAAPLLPGLIRRRDVARLAATILIVITAAVVIAALSLATGAVPAISRALAQRELDPTSFVPALAIIAACGGVAAGSALMRLSRAPAALAAFLACACITFGLAGYVVLNPVNSPAVFMQQTVVAAIGTNTDLGMLRWKEQFVLFADRKVKTFGYARRDPEVEANEGKRWVSADQRRRLLVPERWLPVFAGFPVRRLGSRHGDVWYVVAPHGATFAGG